MGLARRLCFTHSKQHSSRLARATKLVPPATAHVRTKKDATRMDESKAIVRLNIEYYKRLLATQTDPNKLETIARLLAEQEAKLQEIERKERG